MAGLLLESSLSCSCSKCRRVCIAWTLQAHSHYLLRSQAGQGSRAQRRQIAKPP